MSTLFIPRTYADGDVLYESDLDQIATAIETLVNTTKFSSENFATSGLTASSKIQDNAITTVKILDGEIGTNQLAAADITEAKLATGVITEAKIADDVVTYAKFDTVAITRKKLYPITLSVSETSGIFSSSGTSYVDVTNLSINYTTSGLRPVIVSIEPYEGSTGYIGVSSDNNVSIRILRNGSDTIYQHTYANNIEGGFHGARRHLAPGICYIGVETAGTHNYKVQVKDGIFSAINLVLKIMEI